MSDNAPHKLTYEIHPSDPMTITVKDVDGKKYRVTVRVAILEVVNTGQKQEKDGRQLPNFQFKAQLVAETDPDKDITES